MDWFLFVFVGATMLALLALRFRGSIGLEAAAAHVRAGAKIIDVRSPDEFREGHVPGALNVPLGDLEGGIERVAPRREEVLLVHCLSGGRSGLARARLRRMGYRHVFNLGSLGRAQALARQLGR